jgi:hypothetical protein
MYKVHVLTNRCAKKQVHVVRALACCPSLGPNLIGDYQHVTSFPLPKYLFAMYRFLDGFSTKCELGLLLELF